MVKQKPLHIKQKPLRIKQKPLRIKQKPLHKDITREIHKSLGRFLSIVIIVALGVAFFVGIRATGPSMSATAEQYYEEANLMDLRLLSTFGFTKEDVAVLQDLDPRIKFAPAYTVDLPAEHEQRELVMKLYSIDLAMLSTTDASFINRPILTGGRMPTKKNECLLDEQMSNVYALGDDITFTSPKDPMEEVLHSDRYEVVGYARLPLYVSKDRGHSAIGNGVIDGFVLLSQENFAFKYYHEIYSVAAQDGTTIDAQERAEIIKAAVETVKEDRIAKRYSDIQEEGNEKIADAQVTLDDANLEAQTELAKAQTKIDDAQIEIDDGKQKLADGEITFAKETDDAKDKIASGKKELADAKKELDTAKQQIDEGNNALKDAQAQLDAGKAQIIEVPSASLDAMSPQDKAAYEQQMAQMAQAQAQIDGQVKALATAQEQYDQGLTKYTQGMRTMRDSEKKLEQAIADAEEEFAKARVDIAEGETKLADGMAELADARITADQKIADAQVEIDQARKDLSELKMPKWYLLDRQTIPSQVSFEQDAKRIAAIGKVFPLIFLLVAQLVCMTTITRMVEEQRSQIGTLKSIGYHTASIAVKYIFYAFFASLLGSVVGATLGAIFLPPVIYQAYSILYTLPTLAKYVPVGPIAMASLASILLSSLTAFAVCYKEMLATPAHQMRPRAPKIGKRVFLERFAIWKKFTFSQKVTARNLFRYKKRLVMTVIGIAGCTALLVTGFGIKDSVESIFPMQFGVVLKYDVSLTTEDAPAAQAALMANDQIDSSLAVYQTSMDALVGGKLENVSVIVPEQIDQLNDYISLRNRITQEPLTLSHGAVISEKLSILLGLSVGDMIELQDDKNQRAQVEIAGITENYAQHFVYMSRQTYQTMMGEDPESDAIYLLAPDLSVEDAAGILAMEDIDSISFMSDRGAVFKESLDSMYLVIYILIIAAALLAFVVLFNLTNINISERIRELATIKVLGFYDGEVSGYVYRENAWITLMGILVGLVLGFFLHQTVMATVEVNMVMFGRSIHTMSYVLSAILTMLFAAMVNFFMNFKLQKIDMVESLKSIE